MQATHDWTPQEIVGRDRYQRRLELVYSSTLFVFMLLVAVTFLVFPNISLYVRFSLDLHMLIMPTFFFALCIGGAALAPAIYLFRDRLGVTWKRQLAMACVSPVALYTIAVGLYVALTGTAGFGVVVFILFMLPYVQLPFAIYRE